MKTKAKRSGSPSPLLPSPPMTARGAVDHAFAVMNQRAYEVFRSLLVEHLAEGGGPRGITPRQRRKLVDKAAEMPLARLATDPAARALMRRLVWIRPALGRSQKTGVRSQKKGTVRR